MLSNEKGPTPFSVEPFTSDSVMVALHAHGGGAPAQGFHDGFFNRPGSFFGAGPAQSVPQNSHGVHDSFTTRPLGRVPIASSEVVSFYCNCKKSVLGITLAAFKSPEPLGGSIAVGFVHKEEVADTLYKTLAKAKCRGSNLRPAD